MPVSKKKFFKQFTVTTAFVPADFGFPSTGIIIVNTSGNVIDFSFDGTNVDGKLIANQVLAFYGREEGQISVKSAAGSEVVNVFAWALDTNRVG